eukprot:TRINITY_DN3789_c0_g1_i1.p1 TRINITY_DN3789_c0_g1~~TRINITY_DN3789_c0_g1_i1.p1  ORF type:complete len:630 (-),score=113.66 TRINITY_DN3789_c0_g1_i1:2000-3889(-)
MVVLSRRVKYIVLVLLVMQLPIWLMMSAQFKKMDFGRQQTIPLLPPATTSENLPYPPVKAPEIPSNPSSLSESELPRPTDLPDPTDPSDQLSFLSVPQSLQRFPLDPSSLSSPRYYVKSSMKPHVSFEGPLKAETLIPMSAVEHEETTVGCHGYPIEHYGYGIPYGLSLEHYYRYSTKNLYWNKCDSLFYKFAQFNKTLELPPPSVVGLIERVCSYLTSINREKLCKIFARTFPNTLQTTVQMLHDGTAYVITGDIPLMWLRDSAAQVNQYLPLAPEDPHIQIIIEGLLRRDMKFIQMDPYGSSFRLFMDFDHAGKKKLTEWDYRCGRTIHVAQHDYEPDSLCYFVRLSYRYWKTTEISDLFDEEWLKTVELIIDTLTLEQSHNELSSYRYPTLKPESGSKTCSCGLTWVGMRPSDDSCKYHFLIPTNMFVVVSMRQIVEVLTTFYPNEISIKAKASSLATSIDDAIHEHAVIKSSRGPIYAYEVDGCGNYNLMDDANVPSLLSIPYLNYTSPHDPEGIIAENTRQFVLSKKNPHFHKGSKVEGVSSPHTPGDNVWPMAIAMRGLTSSSRTEINTALEMIEAAADKSTFLMHESVGTSQPSRFTRPWFAWANSIVAEFIYTKLDDIEVR